MVHRAPAPLRYPAERRVDVYAAAMRGLLELETDPDRRAKYVDFKRLTARGRASMIARPRGGVWRSLAARLLWEQEVGSSNLPTPTTFRLALVR